MCDDEMIGRSVRVLVGSTLLALALFVTPASAQSHDRERAIARNADDAALQWGPCPDFLPSGCALTVLHGDPAKADADVFFKVPAGARLPLHWHTSAERMVLVAGELHVSYEGQPTVILKPGAYAYGPAKLAHGGSCVSATPCVLFIAFESPVDAFAGEAP
jgi:quercetin dioxygenase-like cupin family protein